MPSAESDRCLSRDTSPGMAANSADFSRSRSRSGHHEVITEAQESTLISEALRLAVRKDADYADARVASITTVEIAGGSSQWRRPVTAYRAEGGVRAVWRGGQGFVSVVTPNASNLRRAVRKAVSLAKVASRKGGAAVTLAPAEPIVDSCDTPVRRHPRDVHVSEKMKLVRVIANHLDSHYGDDVRGWVRYHEVSGQMSVGSTEGTSVSDKIVRTVVSVSALARRDPGMAPSEEHVGGNGGFELVEEGQSFGAADTAAFRVVDRLNAPRMENGITTALLGPAATGVLVHEVVGHLCEGDLVDEGESAFGGSLGQRLFGESLTVTDDPRVPGLWGSAEYDCEGTSTRKRDLIREGVISEFLHTRETAGALRSEPNGSARLEDAVHYPAPRMSNTFTAPGEWSEQDILRDTKSGILARHISGAMTDTTTGSFQLLVDDGYRVNAGSLRSPVRNTWLIGNVFDALGSVDAIGREMSTAHGFCFKRGQTVPVSYGGPMMRVRRVLASG